MLRYWISAYGWRPIALLAAIYLSIAAVIVWLIASSGALIGLIFGWL